jgi:peptidase S41-like protein
MKRMIVVVVLAAAASAGAQPKQPDIQIDAAVRTQVIDASLAALQSRYVFPDVAAKIETAIRERVKAHAYDRVTSGTAFAEALTKDLQAVSHDKHMRVFYSAEPVPNDPPPDAQPSEAEKARFHTIAQRRNAEFVKVERLEGNIGYLRFDAFLSPEEAGPRAAAAMTFLADTDALIIDARENHGGDPASVAIVVSYLYDAGDEIHINDIYWRPDNSTHQYWTLPSLPGRRYPKKPVYVLTSHETFSGGEEFAYDLQTEKRATLVGEVTGGGANPGGPSKVGEHFALFVPQGRAVNPVTKTNWEGTGVKPDVETTAAKALDTAYLAALREQRKRVNAKGAPRLYDEIEQAIGKLEGKR